MAWSVTLASKMTGKEIPEEEVEKLLQDFVTIPLAVCGPFAQHPIFKKMKSDLCTIAIDCRKKMAELNTDKSYVYGWYKAQHFSDYIERVVGEINFKFISILIIITTTLTGDYGQQLEKLDETDFYGSLEFGAELLWNGEFVLDINDITSLASESSAGPFPQRTRQSRRRATTQCPALGWSMSSTLSSSSSTLRAG